uniref:Helicase ATP-binding domain-containing protein n=1 Tax=viral metagenome TaxID=1070528 RepID=A0A6C0H6S0_9ZZZZ
MVVFCIGEYNGENINEFNNYPYPLSDFQKYGIEGIIKGNNVLVTAHTSSGKTTIAMAGIQHFINKGKKVIYTSPIKALSNQKFHELSNKYPNISFGLLTGDIKHCYCADTIICTTEILLNKLRNKDIESANILPLDIEKEVGCIIFDEVHYINDEDRGKIWEESLLLLPKNIQIIMLSATLDKPEIFGNWIEKIHPERKVWLIPTDKRIVPLTHYLFITCNNGRIKLIKNEEISKKVKKQVNTLTEIKSSDGKFNESEFHNIKKTIDLIQNDKMAPTFAINKCVEYLNQNDMLPAIFFVFSKKKIELFAKKMNVVVLEDDSKVRYLVKNECESILKNKFQNYKEYTQLPEYEFLISLLEKGVGIHHAGLLPVFRELIEILFEKGYIKVLFATETLAVGINFAIKTCVFTSIEKHDGKECRYLLPHEYNQISGRSGRRNIDTKGNVIHLVNLYRKIELNEFKKMLEGNPQKLISKFKLSVQSVLFETENLAEKSMICYEIDKELEKILFDINTLEQKIMQIPQKSKELADYENLELEMKKSKNKNKQKELKYQMELIKKQKGRHLDEEIQKQQEYLYLKCDICDLKKEYEFIENYNSRIYNNMRSMLSDFINSPKNKLTIFFKEVPCLVFSDLIYENIFDNLTKIQIIQLLSCFTQIKVSDDIKTIIPPKFLNIIQQKTEFWKIKEFDYGVNTGEYYEIHFDLINEIEYWATNCNDEISCNQFLLKIQTEKNIYNGDFVKAVLKINNCIEEIKNCCEFIGNLMVLEKINDIPNMLLKHIVNNQSLYI